MDEDFFFNLLCFYGRQNVIKFKEFLMEIPRKMEILFLYDQRMSTACKEMLFFHVGKSEKLLGKC